MPRVRCTPSPTCWSSTPCGANRRSVPRTTGCRTGRSRPKKCANGNIRILRKDLTATVGNVMVFGAAARYNPGFTLADCRGRCHPRRQPLPLRRHGCDRAAQPRHRASQAGDRPSPGKGRVISITADATHYVNCGGYIRMIDCTFENQKDDATNIHGLYMAVERSGTPTNCCRWRNSGQYGVDSSCRG